MNKLIAYVLFVAFFVSGCVMRTVAYEVDRVDQEVKGNRGIIGGKALPEAEETQAKKTRTMYDIEIELPFVADVEKDTLASYEGNRGYVGGKALTEKKRDTVKEKQRGSVTLKGRNVPVAPQVVYQSPIRSKTKRKEEEGIVIEKRVDYEMYMVEKGDTLQKISDKVYGTTKRWKKIYEANKGTLKSPDKIKPGQELVIPKE